MIKGKKIGQSKSNRLWVSIFTVFLFLPFSVFAGVGDQTIEGVGRFLKGITEKTDDFFTAAARSSNEGIDLEFNRTLDEILEMKGMDREALPGHILSQLREATRDPMKLIVPEKPGGHPLHYFQDHEHSDVFRAFFQKRLDVNNRDHMEGLMTSVHDMAEETGARVDDILSTLYEYDNFALIPDQVWIENLYASVYSLAIRGVHVDDISPGGKEPFHTFIRHFEEAMESGSADSYIINPHFRLPEIDPYADRRDIPLVATGRRDPLGGVRGNNFDIGDFENNPARLSGDWVDDKAHGKMVEETVFKYVAANPEKFVGRMAEDLQTKEAVFRFWAHKPFRKLVFESIGRDNRHLLSDWEFLLGFWREAKSVEGGTARFATFVSASFKNVNNSYSVGVTKHNDVFWNTATRASDESDEFSRELAVLVRSMFGDPVPQGTSSRVRHMEFPMAPETGNQTAGPPLTTSRAVPIRWQ